MPFTLMLKAFNKIDIDNVKLTTLAGYFRIEFEAHNSMSDIETTREIFYKLYEGFIK